MIAGMLAGVYTGGTPNLAAIKIMLGVPNETYLLIHSYDMAVSLLYLTFVLSVGIPLFRKILHYPAKNGTAEKHMPVDNYDENPYKEFIPNDFSKENYNKIDLHRPYVDDIFLVSPTGQKMVREADLIDVWFDSGAMPYAQVHYPFSGKFEGTMIKY